MLLQDNCRFCRILSQVLVICAKFISYHCCISSIISNLHLNAQKLHNCKCCALRGSLNLMAPNFELCCLSLPQFYRKSHDTFYSLTQDSSYVLSASSAHFGMKFAYFWFWIPRNKPNKGFGVQGFRLELKVSKGIREHLHIHRISFCLQFLKIQAKALWNIQLWLLDLTHVHFHRPDIVNARRFYFLVHAVTSRSDCWIDSTLQYQFPFSWMLRMGIWTEWILSFFAQYL